MAAERADAMIDKEKSFMYDDLVGNPNSIFFNRTKTEVFVAAAAMGYYLKEFEPIESKNRQDLFITSTLSSRSADNIWLLKSIAISHSGIDALYSLKDVIRIAQDYANSGIVKIHEMLKSEDMRRSMVMLMTDALEKQESSE